MINYKEAIEIITHEFAEINPRIIDVDLIDSPGYVLAEDIYSDIDQPPFDNSAMDGIAVKLNSEINQWTVVGEISAGNYDEYSFSENEAVRIMTGAKLPNCVDTIIPIEDLEEQSDYVRLLESAKTKKGNHVRYRGENLRSGQLALAKNTLIRAMNIPIMASLGRSKVKVFDKFKIGILSTGDELIEITDSPIGDKIRATNVYSLQCQIIDYGQEPRSFGFVSDDIDLIENKIDEILLSDIDILLTTGGVSVGKYDYLREILAQKGVDEIFWKVNIKPGKPLYFGKYNNSSSTKYIFGLPGNPVSAFVTYLVFVQKSIDYLFGINRFEKVFAKLSSNLKKKDGKRHFSRGILEWSIDNQRYHVIDAGSISSGDMASLSNANCLIIFEEDKELASIGEDIECWKI